MTTNDQTRTVALPLRLPQNTYDALKAFSEVSSQSMNEIASIAIREYLSSDQNRERFDALIESLANKHRVALDKLADL